MRLPILTITLAAIAAAATGCKTTESKSTVNARPAHWGYEGEDDPSHWGSLNPAYIACDRGTTQSPIDITKTSAGSAGAWKLNYKATSLRIAHHEHVIDIVDNGHTIQVTADEGSTLQTAKNTYQLKQFHFHTPSEHTINGKHFPMEVHFVHQSADGNFAVVSAMFTEGSANDNLAKLIANFPKAKGDELHFPNTQIDLNLHLPANAAAYTYMGSFTTPPCTENVEWLVFRDPISASKAQLDAFAGRLHHNNRPLQPLNNRTVGTGSFSGSTSN